MVEEQYWAGIDSEIGTLITAESSKMIEAYRAQPKLIVEHFEMEREILTGGYGRRQLFELVQNAADAIQVSGKQGRVEIVLAGETLYCANEGSPLDARGAQALLMAYLSGKTGDQIGRFGLGFKSVIGISDAPEFFSRSGSFRFDPILSDARIRVVVPGCAGTPRLRLAQVIDPVLHAASDERLANMMQWATTVVKLPLRHESLANLSEDIRLFPAHFLIFAPWIAELHLIDETNNHTRIIQIQKDGENVLVNENGQNSMWSVFSDALPVSALQVDATEEVGRLLSGRGSLPVSWAVPRSQGKRARGNFWAFFPTKTETTLSGILNAPWKTNSDRENLLEGPFNRALLDFAVQVVSRNIGKLLDDSDPGGILDVLPARESCGWADTHLAGLLYRQLTKVPCIPSVKGSLRLPEKIRLRPDIAMQASVRTWLDRYTDVEPEVWCHRSVEQRERRARAVRLGAEEWELEEWLPSIASSRVPETSIAAIMLANTILCDGKSGVSHEFLFRRSFILATTGQLLPPSFSALYVDHVDGDQVGAGDFFVHPEVLSFPGIREILEGPLNLRRYGPSAQLERFLSAWNLWTAWASPDWDLFWSLTRKIEIENVVELVHRYKRADKISVRSKNHQWISIGCSLLPGEIIPKEGSSVDDEVAIDSGGYHEIDVALLEKLGATRTIKAIEVAKCEWFKEYQSAAIQKYIGSLPAGRQRPQDSFLAFNGQRAYGPLDLLKCMSLPSRSRMVKRLLGPSFYIAHWELFHSTRADKYPRLKFPNPVLWMIHKYGAFETSLGPRLTKECVNPSLAVWRAVLPVADCSQEHARILELPSSLDVLSDNLWIAAFKSVLGLSDMGEAARFYVEACYYRPAPTSILCDVGGKSVEQSVCDVCVTSDHAAFIAAQAANNPILFVEDAEKAKRLHEQWKMPWAIDVEVKFIATGVDELLVDRFPGLIAHLSPSFLELMIRPCESIWIEETNSNGLPDRKILENCAINSPSGLLYPNDWDNPQLLDGLARTLKLDMSGIDRKAILDYLVREERRKCTSAVCAEQAVPEKLLVALGSKALRSGLPVFWNERCNSDQDVANCALAVYGVQVLANYGNELEAAGFNPPKRWAGSRRALEFVRELGIPDQYAGFKSSDYRQPWFEVDGPIRLSPLHPYQELICQRLVQAFQRVPPGRGMVSLPTGAGKTRVVVDAIVRWIDRCQTKQKQTLILWIAQSDELCEQSVQTWSRTWRASGPADCPLRITRMWGRTNQQAENLPYGCHVVIATYQTLRPRTEDRSFLWVFKPDCVVIDEAHGAIAPSYTTILERLGLTYAQTDRCLVGLTATPFRSGEFEDETLRLVRRFASERFDHGVFLNDDPYADLRRQQILATVDHQELEGVDIQLTADEEISFSTYATLPASAERRLGENVGRNKRLIECLKGLDRDWPVIVFAASVEQAKMLSVELCLSGIESRAITGDTEDGVRMHYIQQFKEGKIRILTNYNVLTAGFDAPAVRAVCIARPVFSRVLYQQMIGRGLRGPLNGGKDKCLLINVSDNMSQYGKQLAFRHFEYLWKSGNG